MSTAIVSGYFDPLHKGHLELIHKAKEEYKHVFVIVNNNCQAIMKKGEIFMDEIERTQIVGALRDVVGTMIGIDTDNTVCRSLESIKVRNPDEEFVFVNGGDVKKKCREEKVCKELGIKCIYGFGKKIQSSSWLTKK